MEISAATLNCQFLNPQQVEPPKSRCPTKRLDSYMRDYEMSFDRVSKVRKAVLANPSQLHTFDQILAYPEQYKSRSIRALIHLSKHVEETAESCSDLSGVAERLTRNILSAGNKSDLAMVIASGVGRIIAAQLNLFGVAIHKAAGACLYCLSTLIGLAAVGLAHSNYGSLRSLAEIEHAKRHSSFDYSGYRLIALKLLTTRERMLRNVLERTEKPNNKVTATIQKWAKYMSRHQRSCPPYLVSQRRTNCDYIWNNLHQYGPVTRALMHFAYGVFHGINKLLVSFDKHLGVYLGNKVLGKALGPVLGCRLGQTLSVGTAAAISVPLSPYIIGISTVGAMACGVALMALILAKLNVHISHDWKGNIQKSLTRQVFGKVTPT